MNNYDASSLSFYESLEDFIVRRFTFPSNRIKSILFNQLMIDAQTRQATCMKSIHRTKLYFNWLVNDGALKLMNGKTLLTEQKRFDHQENESIILSNQSIDADGRLRKALDSDQVNKKNEITFFTPYLRSVYNHLFLQREILKKEVELASAFSASAVNHLQTNISKINDKNPEIMQSCVKILLVASDNQLEEIGLAAIGFNSIMEQMNHFNDFIDSRKSQLETIDRITTVLHKIVLHLAKKSLPESRPARKDPPKTIKGHRMQYPKKISGNS
jgi:hypothetical protein